MSTCVVPVLFYVDEQMRINQFFTKPQFFVDSLMQIGFCKSVMHVLYTGG